MYIPFDRFISRTLDGDRYNSSNCTELPLCSVKIISDRSMGDRNGGSAIPNGIISIYIPIFYYVDHKRTFIVFIGLAAASKRVLNLIEEAGKEEGGI